MVRLLILCCALALLPATAAQALCRDDLQAMQPRIARLKGANPPRYNLALKWWDRAVDAQPLSEIDCEHYLGLARKALEEPLPQVANCRGPNAYLPGCQNPGAPVGPVDFGAGAGAGPAGLGGFPVGGGGGGGGGRGGTVLLGPDSVGLPPASSPGQSSMGR